MDEKLLISLGLSQNLARAYRALVLKKSLRPTQYIKLSGESRSNAYAILDKLTELGLATKLDENKKFTYYPMSPLALKSLLTTKISETELQLDSLERKLPQMLSEYHAGGEQPKVAQHKGAQELEQLYVDQMQAPDSELYFIRSKADVPYFGLEKMRVIRALAKVYKKRRYGITPIVSSRPTDPRRDSQTNLKRAWIMGSEYTSSVEWAVSGDTVQAICFKGEGYGISIQNAEVAESFKQILSLLYKYIRTNPDYAKLPKIAKSSQK